jgi:hypothetical protein
MQKYIEKEILDIFIDRTEYESINTVHNIRYLKKEFRIKRELSEIYKIHSIIKAKSECDKCKNIYFKIYKKRINIKNTLDLYTNCCICHTEKLIEISV